MILTISGIILMFCIGLVCYGIIFDKNDLILTGIMCSILVSCVGFGLFGSMYHVDKEVVDYPIICKSKLCTGHMIFVTDKGSYTSTDSRVYTNFKQINTVRITYLINSYGYRTHNYYIEYINSKNE